LARAGSERARIAAASRAAFDAPALPIASAPTGMPAGICTIDSSESSPCSAFDWIGTPRIGNVVFDAMTPARCAAPPAPAMMILSPRLCADAAYSSTTSGVRCADMTLASQGISSLRSMSDACFMVSQSDWLPMRMPTSGDADIF
jgi:hypothetical protein